MARSHVANAKGRGVIMEVVRAGQLTTVQDLGRPGWRKDGVAVGGGMDCVALHIANLLVGNSPAAAAVEMTLVGPHLRFEFDALIALCGADFGARIGGLPIPGGRPVWLPGGTELHFAEANTGRFGYLAIAGGVGVPVVLGGRGTCLRTQLGGWHGRPLRAGDRLPILPSSVAALEWKSQLASQAVNQPAAWPSWWTGPLVTNHVISSIRVVPGRHWLAFSEADRQHFQDTPFEVTSHSDRMGYRLSGARLSSASDRSLLSEAMVRGAVQVPPDGHPIVLMADGPVTGGYPVIAQVASIDWPTMAQLRPGDRVRFVPISLSESLRLYRNREMELARLQAAIRLQFSRISAPAPVSPEDRSPTNMLDSR